MGIMRRRMRRRAIVGVAAAGVAYHQGKKHQRRAQEDEQYQDEEATEYAPAPPEDAGPDAADLEQIEKLARLHESGALTDEEFASAKAKLLA
jgi:hypothetical protein